MRSTRRPIDGVLLLDKPCGPSSNAALQQVKWLYRADKAGHTGSLDPLASGLLPICFGAATKLSVHLLTGDKGYRAIARLGIRTDTLDAQGRPISEGSIERIEVADIEAALAAFRGEILQTPPMFSAIKQGGTPLYELARQGIEVDRAVRQVRIDRLTLREWTPPFLLLDIDCASGTYIRSLVDDLGLALGCGAHVHALQRTWAAPFRQVDMVPMATLEALLGDLPALDAFLLPIEVMVAGMPAVSISGADLVRFSHGNPVVTAAPICQSIAVHDPNGRLLGIARSPDGIVIKAVKVLNR